MGTLNDEAQPIDLVDPQVEYRPEEGEEFDARNTQHGAEDGLSHPMGNLTNADEVMQQRPKTGHTEGSKEVRFAWNATMAAYTGAESAAENVNLQ